jgi:hypothetical protein
MTSSLPAARVPRAPTLEQLIAFRAQLEEQRGFRIDQLRLLCVTRVRASRGSREVTASLMDGARCALREVKAALQRMDEGSYGLGTSCGERLPLERLEVLPQVAMCMPCQRAAEAT